MFGKNLKYYRIKNGYTPEQLAEKTGIPQVDILLYEQGRKPESMEVIKTFAQTLGVRVSDLLAARQELAITFSEFHTADIL